MSALALLMAACAGFAACGAVFLAMSGGGLAAWGVALAATLHGVAAALLAAVGRVEGGRQ